MAEIERRSEEASAHIRATIMNEFCEVMHKTGLSPIAVMRLAAQAVGSIYREVWPTFTLAPPVVLAAGVLMRRPTSRCSAWLLRRRAVSSALNMICGRCG